MLGTCSLVSFSYIYILAHYSLDDMIWYDIKNKKNWTYKYVLKSICNILITKKELVIFGIFHSIIEIISY